MRGALLHLKKQETTATPKIPKNIKKGLDFSRPFLYTTTMNLNLDLALAVALEAHVGQTRKVGIVEVPFVVHPIQVMTTLALHGENNEDVLCAALLHDAVEDSDNREYVRREISLKLGKNVLSIVDKLTLPAELSDHTLPSYDKKKKYAHIAELLNGGDLDAIKVKLADRLCNIRNMIENGEDNRSWRYARAFYDCAEEPFWNLTKTNTLVRKLWVAICSYT